MLFSIVLHARLFAVLVNGN